MQRKVRFIGSLLAVAAFAAPAAAHPGHGSTDPQSVLHLLEPLHLMAWLAPTVIVGLLAAKLLRRNG